MITVAIVDDHEMIREGLAYLIGKRDDMRVLQSFDSGEALLAAYAKGFVVDVILLDIQMKQINGIETLRQLKIHHPQACVIIITVFQTPMIIKQAIELGAMGTLVKDCSIEELGQAIIAAHKGQRLSHSLKTTTHHLETFTNQQLAIVSCLLKGYSNQEIANQLHLSLGTIKNANTEIFQKLGVKQRSEAIVLLQKYGMR